MTVRNRLTISSNSQTTSTNLLEPPRMTAMQTAELASSDKPPNIIIHRQMRLRQGMMAAIMRQSAKQTVKQIIWVSQLPLNSSKVMGMGNLEQRVRAEGRILFFFIFDCTSLYSFQRYEDQLRLLECPISLLQSRAVCCPSNSVTHFQHSKLTTIKHRSMMSRARDKAPTIDRTSKQQRQSMKSRHRSKKINLKVYETRQGFIFLQNCFITFQRLLKYFPARCTTTTIIIMILAVSESAKQYPVLPTSPNFIGSEVEASVWKAVKRVLKLVRQSIKAEIWVFSLRGRVRKYVQDKIWKIYSIGSRLVLYQKIHYKNSEIAMYDMSRAVRVEVMGLDTLSGEQITRELQVVRQVVRQTSELASQLTHYRKPIPSQVLQVGWHGVQTQKYATSPP